MSETIDNRKNRPARAVSRRTLVKGAAAFVAAAPLAGRGGFGPFGSHARFLAHAQAAPIQFTLVPSGIKDLFPNATATVSITPGDLADDVQVVAQNMPPDTVFTCYFLQSPTRPFGAAQYCMDLKTDAYGYGTTFFHGITTGAYAMIAETPGESQNEDGPASGIQLEHFGMWFSSLEDAKKVLNNPNLTGTPFDAGTPPLHAGPQAMNDGSPDPKF